jgi:hypothetical protein
MFTTKRSYFFLAVWFLTIIVNAMMVSAFQGTEAAEAEALVGTASFLVMAMLLICTAAFLYWLPGPDSVTTNNPEQTDYARFLGVLLLMAVSIFLLTAAVRQLLLFGLPVVALAVLWSLQLSPSPAVWRYALGLGVLAGLASIAAGWVTIAPWLWTPLQLALVATCLPAGWALARYIGLAETHLGEIHWLTGDSRAALKEVGAGFVLAIPWALGLVTIGGLSQADSWVTQWWQPLAAVQPAITEVAWGRALAIPLLILFLRRTATPRLAVTAAVLLNAYWFAFLRTEPGLEGLLNSLLIGTLFSLPAAYLWLRRGFETAVGFHFALELFRYGLLFWFFR